MLGTLARWLRLFGFDASFLEPGVEDDRLAELARTEGRWLLTRDRRLAAVGPRTVLIRAEELEEQLIEVFTRLGLRPDAALEAARCSDCNGALEEVEREQVAAAVPPYVLATARRFCRCRDCGRVYWPGTHGPGILDRMRAVTQRLND